MSVFPWQRPALNFGAAAKGGLEAKIRADPRVQELDQEDEDYCKSGKMWTLFLRAGWWSPDMEGRELRECTLKEIASMLKSVERDPR